MQRNEDTAFLQSVLMTHIDFSGARVSFRKEKKRNVNRAEHKT